MERFESRLAHTTEPRTWEYDSAVISVSDQDYIMPGSTGRIHS